MKVQNLRLKIIKFSVQEIQKKERNKERKEMKERR